MAGKKFKAALAQVESGKLYALAEAITLAQKIHPAKFDETVEVTMVLGVDPRKADQMVRGTIVLPHGLGKSKRVAVIAGSPEKQREAQDAGADEVGGDDLVDKIKGGYLDFDALIATPDMMRSVGALGKILGPRGLMPESEDRNRHSRRHNRRQRDQSGQGRISRGQDRRDSRPGRQSLLHLRQDHRQCEGAD